MAQSTLWSNPVFGGTLAAVHVAPASLLKTIAPCPCPAVVAVNPVTRHDPPVIQVSDPAPCKPAGRLPPRCQLRPKSVEWADQNVVPSVAMTVQSPALGHSTLVITVAPAGMASACQLAPASWVVTTMPAEVEPSRPTAIQSRAVGHEIPVRAGAGSRPRGCATHVRPPSTVASTTVASTPVALVPVALAPVVGGEVVASRSGDTGGSHCPTEQGRGTRNGVELPCPRRRGLPHDVRGARLLPEHRAEHPTLGGRRRGAGCRGDSQGENHHAPAAATGQVGARQGRRDGLQGTGGGQ